MDESDAAYGDGLGDGDVAAAVDRSMGDDAAAPLAEGGAAAAAAAPSGIEEAASFSLRSDTLKLVLMAVSSVYNGKKDQYGVVKINQMGVRILVETAAKSMQAHVFINRDRCIALCARLVLLCYGPHCDSAARARAAAELSSSSRCRVRRGIGRPRG